MYVKKVSYEKRLIVSIILWRTNSSLQNENISQPLFANLVSCEISIWSGYLELALIRYIHISEISIWSGYLELSLIRYVHISEISIWSGYLEFALIGYIHVSEVSIWSRYLIGHILRRKDDYPLWMCLTLSGLCWAKKTGT